MALTLTVTDLAAERGGRPVFSGVSFRLVAGESLSVVGPNGAGKSTLLRALAGLLRPTAGHVRLDPPHAADEDRPVRERAHYLGHADALKGGLTAHENLAFAVATAGDPLLSPEESLHRFGLSHAALLQTAYLSAGQRRRGALARLAASYRPLWLLDEPATALDLAAQKVLAAVMRQHLDTGGLIVAATHAPLGLAGARELRLGPPPPDAP